MLESPWREETVPASRDGALSKGRKLGWKGGYEPALTCKVREFELDPGQGNPFVMIMLRITVFPSSSTQALGRKTWEKRRRLSISIQKTRERKLREFPLNLV